MASDCSHWKKIKASPVKFNYKSVTEGNSSWQQCFVRRKLEGLKFKCNDSYSEILISVGVNEGSSAEDIISKDIECMHCYQQWNGALMNKSLAQPIEEFRDVICSEELGTSLLSETSKEQANDRTYVSLRVAEEKEELNSLHSNAHYSSPRCIPNDVSPKKVPMEKKGASRNVLEREVESHIHMMEVENEVHILRDALRSQHQAIQDLCAELEEERNASSTAANEALSMILRLQQEKAAVRLEANQYKRLAEEKIAHDQESLTFFEELIYRKDKEIDDLEYEIQAYRHRLLSIGFDDIEIGKIRWSGQSYLNDTPNDRDRDYDSWLSSYTERVTQNGFDGCDTLDLKISNNTHSRDLCKLQDKKGKRHIFKNDRRCLDDMWNDETNAVGSCQTQHQLGEVCSNGQDRASCNSNRIQLEEYSVSTKVIKESSNGYSNNTSSSYASQRMELDCKLQEDFEDYDVEPGFTAPRLKVHGAVHEMALSTPENSPRGNNLILWERIEKLEDCLQKLSRQRRHNCHLDGEWVSTNRELQKTVAAYTASLREGARSHWRLSLDNTGICDSSMVEAGVQSAKDLRFSNVSEKSKEMECQAKTESEVLFSEKNATNLKVTGDKSDATSNVHDVYVIQHEYERNGKYTSHKGHALKFDLEEGDRLGKPDPLLQKHEESSSFLDPRLIERKLLQSPLHNAYTSKASESFCNALSVVSSESMLESSPVQEEVKQLSTRLQTLEEDREFMKQAIDSLKREREELSLFKEIAQQLLELKPPSKSCEAVKSPPPQEDTSIVNFMKASLADPYMLVT